MREVATAFTADLDAEQSRGSLGRRPAGRRLPNCESQIESVIEIERRMRFADTNPLSDRWRTMAQESNLAMMQNRATRARPSHRALTHLQASAITLEAALGDKIRCEIPYLVDEYRAGLTAPRLVEKHGLDRRFGVPSKNAIAAVRNAIRGYNGYFYDSYIGLVPTAAERANLALAHNRQTGIELAQQKKGIHALSSKQKAEIGRKGGLIRGPLSYLLRIGCHALPPEILREHCRLIAPLGGKAGGRASVLAKGLVPYTPATEARCSEIEFASRLAANRHYLGPVRANYRKIAETINATFKRSRMLYTRTTLKIALQRYRRQIRSMGLYAPYPEIWFAEMLTFNPEYQIAPRIKAVQIARTVNDEYHDGQPVRNAVSIRAAIRRYRRELSARSVSA